MLIPICPRKAHIGRYFWPNNIYRSGSDSKCCTFRIWDQCLCVLTRSNNFNQLLLNLQHLNYSCAHSFLSVPTAPFRQTWDLNYSIHAVSSHAWRNTKAVWKRNAPRCIAFSLALPFFSVFFVLSFFFKPLLLIPGLLCSDPCLVVIATNPVHHWLMRVRLRANDTDLITFHVLFYPRYFPSISDRKKGQQGRGEEGWPAAKGQGSIQSWGKDSTLTCTFI